MELVNDFLAVRKAFGWLPAVVAFAIAFPSNQILELVMVCAAVQDFLNFVLFLAINDDGRRRGLLDAIILERGQTVDMEDVMEPEGLGEFKAIVEIANALDNLVWSQLAWP